MMNRRLLTFVMIPVMMMPLAACDNQQVGTLAGAAGGAVAGKAIGGSGTSGTIGIILGALAGGYLGGRVADWLDDSDRREINRTTERALTTGSPGQAYAWQNAETGNRGAVTLNDQPYRNSEGRLCQSITQSAVSSTGQQASDRGTVCRNPDGTWSTVA